MEFKLEDASPEDGKQMLHMIEEMPSPGIMEIIYTRRPNAYESLKQESKETIVNVIKDKNGDIVLQGACVYRDHFINGEKRKLGYMCGFRKNPNFKERINWLEQICSKNYGSEEILYYCSILSENKHAVEVFEKKRDYMPNLILLDEYITYIINPNAVPKIKEENNLIFRQARLEDEIRIIEFLNKEGVKYNFFPVIEDLNSQFSFLRITDFYILECNNEIVTAAALWDQTPYKQYIVKRYNGILRYMKKFNYILKKMNYIPMPKENKVVDFPTVTLFISKNRDTKYYRYFLSQLSNVIKKRYDMFVIGISKSAWQNQVFKNIRNISFKSRLYVLDFNKEKTVYNIIKNNEMINIECGLL